ncbi:hypothetical protein QPC17_08670 [Trueperella bernardiae]|uniref:hypothetical protein n=1 Tax=Trueperella bernardiae TaxID=59561 RepID=UPI002553A9E6|nr:hypothetical protein [Trueperella bernardiae]WIM07802.1 hypothetical protein QPC17_08670 [Trueperella bernardiae]
MDFMEWALQQTSQHPRLANSLVTANGDWLDVLLDDGRTFRFRPGALIRQDAPLDQRAELLDRLISIGIDEAESATVTEPNRASAAKPDDGVVPGYPDTTGGAYPGPSGEPSDDLDDPDAEALIVPIVRSADYFLPATPDSDSIVYIPLTAFLAVGLAHDYPDTIQPIYYDQLEDSREIGEIMSDAVMTLRFMTNGTQQSVEIGITEIAGAQVMTFLQPPNYELSWFSDLDMIQQVADRICEQHPDDIPLFIPASRTKLFIVFADDPHLADFFKLLLAQRNSDDAIYPLPHTVAADGWLEWQPFPDSELAAVLGALRNYFRQKIYTAQEDMMRQWPAFGQVKTFQPRRLTTGERVSAATWDATDAHGSIPHTDFVTFTRSPHPWQEVPAVNITVRTHVAREIWPDGIVEDDTVWPPRYRVTGFPDEDTLRKLRDATDRRF